MPTKKKYHAKVETVTPSKRQRSRRHRNSKTNARVGVIRSHELSAQVYNITMMSERKHDHRTVSIEYFWLMGGV